jgi:hypothetical protein
MTLSKENYKKFFEVYKQGEKYKEALNMKNNKYKDDPDFRERIKQRNREYYHRKKEMFNKMKQEQGQVQPEAQTV